MICLECIHQVNRAFTFKQLCEQSDINLRQYLGKPVKDRPNKKDEVLRQKYNKLPLIDTFGLDDDDDDDSSGNSDGDDDNINVPTSMEENDEKTIAQKQLIRTKMLKRKLTKKKLLSKNGGLFNCYVFMNFFKLNNCILP